MGARAALSVEDWLKQACAGNYEECLRTLAQFANHGEAAVRPLVNALGTGDSDLDLYIGKALAQLGSQGVQGLIAAFDSERTSVRRGAARAASQFAEELAAAMVPGLIRVLKDQDPESRRFASEALGPLGAKAAPALSLLIERMEDPEPSVRRVASFGGVRIAFQSLPLQEAFQLLDRVQQHPAPEVRLALTAVTRLRLKNVSLEPLVPYLVRALSDPDPEVRASAAWDLKKAGPAAKTAFAALKRAVESSDASIRYPAIQGLWAVSGDAAQVLPLVLKWIQDVGGCSEGICDILAGMGPLAAPAVPALIEALQKGGADLRWAAVSALSKIGPAAAEAVPALVAAFQDESGTVAGVAAAALGSIGPAALPALVHALGDPSPGIREYAADALSAMGEAASGSVPNLLRTLLTDKHEEVRCWAAIALGEIGGSKELVPRLIGYLDKGEPYVRVRAARALGKIGQGAGKAIPSLQRAVEERHPNLALEAREALRRIKG